MASFKLKLSLTSVILLFFMFVCPNKLFAQSILFQDGFESGVSDSWQVIHGAWTISSDPIYPENGSWLRGNFLSGTDNEIQAGDFNWHNYELSFDILPKSGADRNIFFRVNNTRTSILPGHDLPVSYSLQPTTGQTYLGKWSLSGFGGLPGSPVTIPLNIKSHISIRIEEQNIRIYLNNSEILNYTDNNNPILFGRIALGVITGSNPSEVWYDNVQVTELIPSPTPTVTPTPTATSTPTPSPTIAPTPTITPTPTPSVFPVLNVPDIKQYSSPWGNHTYDSANLWSNNPTINRWGCALTSAVMILRYYGHDVNPDSLNNWLKSQPDGYVGDGLVNWLAISRYTLQHANSVIPALEYRRLTGISNLVNEIVSGRPAILAVPGHFVVAKSQTMDSFAINDPAYSNRPTLASYGNTFNSIGSYKPTHTDLSYILLTTSQNTNILVTDPNGSVINGYSYTENPLIDDINNSKTSGDPLNAFLYPVPQTGNYKVEVSGNGIYDFDSYLYDKNGNVSTFSKSGLISQEEKDNFSLIVGASNKTKIILNIDTLIEDLEDAYKQKRIRNKRIYEFLKSNLLLTKWAIEHRKISLAKDLLKTFKYEIISVSPIFVDYEAKKVLLEDSSILISQL